jgi:CheY-like chemotaxis protein
MTLERPSILITDDDAAARETLREIFEPAGYRTFLAESGEEAIDIVLEEDVHLALMDLHLPKLSGLETMSLVRQIKGVLPMILITAERDENLLRKALSANAFCVLAKPVSKNVIIYVVTRALQKYYD